MLAKKLSVYRAFCLLILGIAFAVQAFAGSAVIGSVAGSTNATLGGQTLLPNTILFSGDGLQVRDGAAVVAVGSTSRMVFGRDTVASFMGGPNGVTVLLGQGSVSVFHAKDTMGVRLKVGDVSVVPVSGFRTLGEVATLNGAMVVTTREGMLRVEGNGQVVNVAKGKAITVYPSASAPQATGGGNPNPRHVSGATVWSGVNTGLAGAGLIFAALAFSRAGTAQDNANSATSTASAATAAANAAASAAAAAASAAAADANSVGCALNILAGKEGHASPYTPPAGQHC